ncbi:MAG: hypothetical protein ACTHYN_06870 [Marinobacter sp.]|uniref:hypothetical protein n=1 Tax=Marinobacter sp. TaxID=50741 RepID=UPI003F977905
MEYGESVQKVLVRKIRKAEQDLTQLKLDYCRFVFGLAPRTRVERDGASYLVLSVDVDSMEPTDNDAFTRPAISGVPTNKPDQTEPVQLGKNWVLAQPGKN